MTLFNSKDMTGYDEGGPGFVVRREKDAPSRGAVTVTESASKCRSRASSRLIAFFAVATTAVALSACGQGDSKSYDISPIFPLSANKCAKYDGTSEGSGFAAHCWVTKDKCQQAAADWREAMRQGGVTDAIQFEC